MGNFVLFQMMPYTCSYDYWFKSYMPICNFKLAPTWKTVNMPGPLRVKLQNPSIIIIIIYRPPSCLDCDFIDVISRAEQYILTIPAPLPNIILLGDFNFPLINWSNPNSQCPLSSPLFNLSDHLSCKTHSEF